MTDKEQIKYWIKKFHNLEKDYENIENACDKLQEQLESKNKIIDKLKEDLTIKVKTSIPRFQICYEILEEIKDLEQKYERRNN